MELTLEDRIYLLRKTNLPYDLKVKLDIADQLYCAYEDHAAEQLLCEIEAECRLRGIRIYRPMNLT